MQNGYGYPTNVTYQTHTSGHPMHPLSPVSSTASIHPLQYANHDAYEAGFNDALTFHMTTMALQNKQPAAAQQGKGQHPQAGAGGTALLHISSPLPFSCNSAFLIDCFCMWAWFHPTAPIPWLVLCLRCPLAGPAPGTKASKHKKLATSESEPGPISKGHKGKGGAAPAPPAQQQLQPVKSSKSLAVAGSVAASYHGPSHHTSSKNGQHYVSSPVAASSKHGVASPTQQHYTGYTGAKQQQGHYNSGYNQAAGVGVYAKHNQREDEKSADEPKKRKGSYMVCAPFFTVF